MVEEFYLISKESTKKFVIKYYALPKIKIFF
jgi:hypothetical protein